MSSRPSVPDADTGPFAAALAHGRRRLDAAGAAITTFKFDSLVLALRLPPEGATAALAAMIEHRRVEAPPTAFLDVIEGPDPVLEAFVPSGRDGRERVVASRADFFCFWEPEHGGKLTLVDRRTAAGLVWYRTPAIPPSWDVARPFLHVFKGLAPVTGLLPVHAAAVALGQHGLLLAGRGGAGKTTLALACLEAGWRYVGDDFVLIGGPPIRAVNLYRSARVREDMFPHLEKSMTAAVGISVDSGERKGELDLGRTAIDSIGDAAISAVLLPRRTGAPNVTFAPARWSAVLRELAMSTLGSLPGDPVVTEDTIARIIAAVPCFTIDPGARLADVPGALQRFLDSREAASCARV